MNDNPELTIHGGAVNRSVFVVENLKVAVNAKRKVFIRGWILHGGLGVTHWENKQRRSK